MTAATRSTRDAGVDTSTWETWWRFHRDALVDVRRALDAHQRIDHSDGMTDAMRLGAHPDAGLVAAIAAPALRAVLARETNPDLLSAALIALARLDGPTEGTLFNGVTAEWDAGVDDLMAGFLAHPQLSVAETATLAVGIRARDVGAARLSGLLLDDASGRALIARASVPERMRAFAAYGLGLCAERTPSEDLRRWIVHALSQALIHDASASADVQAACVAALGMARLDAYTAYFEHTVSYRRELLDRAASMPASAARVALVADLCSVLADEQRSTIVRAQVPTAIAHVVAGASEDLRAECVRELLGRLANTREKSEVRAGVLLALGDIARPSDTPYDNAARAAISAAARAGDRTAQGFALVSAGKVGQSAWLPEDRPAVVEMEALLLDALEHGKSGAPGFAAMGLAVLHDAHGLIDPDHANEALRRTLTTSGNASTQTAAAIALGLRHDEWSRNALRDRVFSGGADDVRGMYALALGLGGDCDATRTLRDLVSQSAHRPALLRECVTALALLGDRDLTASLTAAMTNARTQAAQIGYAQALALVGDARCLTPLSELVTKADATIGARAYAIRALGTVSDLDPLPWNASYSFDAQYLAASETLTSASGTGILDPR
jgi:hypothetical protein